MIKIPSDEAIHKCYLYIEDPFIPRYLDTGRQTARETLRQIETEVISERVIGYNVLVEFDFGFWQDLKKQAKEGKDGKNKGC